MFDYLGHVETARFGRVLSPVERERAWFPPLMLAGKSQDAAQMLYKAYYRVTPYILYDDEGRAAVRALRPNPIIKNVKPWKHGTWLQDRLADLA